MKESPVIFPMYPILRGLADAWYLKGDREMPYCLDNLMGEQSPVIEEKKLCFL